MWPRAIEFMLGLWIVISPFVFRHGPGEPGIWVNAFIAGPLIWLFACLSFWQPTRRAHFGVLPVALWLVAYGYLGGDSEAPPAYQSNILTGLVLLLFGFIPPDANQPPKPWREHYEQRAKMIER